MNNPFEFHWKRYVAISRIAMELLIIVGVFFETGIFTALAILLIQLSIEAQSYVKYREFVSKNAGEVFMENVGKVMLKTSNDFASLGKKLKIKPEGTARISIFDN